MFAFLHTDQTPSNASYYKGLLFEELLRSYLHATGYDVSLKRTKRNSLEYDIDGVHRVNRQAVVGEAKAHEAAISAQMLAAFVGKTLPMREANPNIASLFLSTSTLTPEAEDFHRSLSSTGYAPVTLCGAELERSVRRELRLPNAEEVERLLRVLVPRLLGQHILYSNLGSFIVAIGTSSEAAFPNTFAVLGSDGTIIEDQSFLSQVQSYTKDVQALQPVSSARSRSPLPEARTVPIGLITATDWTDYRRPASREVFVGRTTELGDAASALLSKSRGTVLEIKARSGVGKSSLLAVLADGWEREGIEVEIHDARDVHAAADVLAIVGRFTSYPGSITNLEDVQPALQHLLTSRDGQPAVFMVDQFESTFATPELFHAYEFVALAIARISDASVAFIYARKDDLLTTHDDMRVDLSRLRGLATPIQLDDLERPEASALISLASTASRRKLSATVHAQVLEFAQGFPWLLKRAMAHIIGKLEDGIPQQILASEGLQLVDLFAEELGELDEVERGYLDRLARALPATYHDLMVRFDGDPLLPSMLDRLTQRRLLRLSAGTYDTYNDVFKEFLVYERLPERSQSSLFRLTPASVVKAFRMLRGRSRFTIEEFKAVTGRDSTTSAYNVLRELRLVGLVERSSSGWFVPEVVREYEHQGRVGEYVRQAVLKNRAVTDFVLRLEQEGGRSKADLALFLQEHFPFVDVQEEVWVSYANTFSAWLTQLNVVEQNSRGDFRPVAMDRESIHRILGNLTLEARGSRPADVPFIPSREISTFRRVLARVVEQKEVSVGTLRAAEKTACNELSRLGFVKVDGSGVVRPLVERVQEFDERVEELLQASPYQEFFKILRSGVRYGEAIRIAFGLTSLSEGTRTALGKKLANWGRFFGHIKEGRLRFDDDSNAAPRLVWMSSLSAKFKYGFAA